MANPQISFRLSEYQLARGLKLIRTIEPAYIPISTSQLVKTIFLDYLAKTSLNKTDAISPDNIIEIQNLILNRANHMSIMDFQQITKKAPSAIPKPEILISTDEKSEITSVSDFSPPKEWIE